MDAKLNQTTDAMEAGQVDPAAAVVYEEFFVPALFSQWTARMLDAVRAAPGHRILDVACGTGVLARAAAQRTGDPISVSGLDSNDGMLAVARRKAPDIMWRFGSAEALPFEDGSFDCVVSQFGLMFFQRPVQALKEMQRVLRQNGHLAVAVWDVLDNSPGYARLADLLRTLFGDDVAKGLHAPFVLGDKDTLHSLCKEAGLFGHEIMTHTGVAQFPSLESWMYTDIRGWTLADSIDDDQFDLLLAEATEALAEFVQEDGSVRFASPAHILTAGG